MSSAFTGFSEDDIRNLQNGMTSSRSSENVSKHIKSSLKTKRASPKNNETKTRKVAFGKTLSADSLTIPEEAKLNKLVPAESKKRDVQQQNASSGEQSGKPKESVEQNTPLQNENELSEESVQNAKPEVHAKQNTPRLNEKTLELSDKKFVDLEEFQIRQKLMEEQNRRRKELLAKALADRTKQTQEEAQRLNEIKDEFRKLDAMLSNDVKILRQQIEVASVEYMEVQKKYNRIEKEFLDAKIALQKKLEKKEMLTEHLCAIIEQNEERKARKLIELLEKLDLKTDVTDDKINEIVQVSEVTSTDDNRGNKIVPDS